LLLLFAVFLYDILDATLLGYKLTSAKLRYWPGNKQINKQKLCTKCSQKVRDHF